MASFILFQGFNTTDTVNTISLLCGFLIIFTGVYLLNLSREDPDGVQHMIDNGNKFDVDGIPTDGMAAPLTRRSMQARRSSDLHRRSASLTTMNSPGGYAQNRRSEERLMHSYDVEAGRERDHFGLSHLTEDSDEDSGGSGNKRTSFEVENGTNGGIQHPRRTRAVDFENVNFKSEATQDHKR